MLTIHDDYMMLRIKNLSITAGLTMQELYLSDVYCDIIDKNIGNYSRFHLGIHEIDNEQFAVIIYFNTNGIIDFFQLSQTYGCTIPSWEKWSEREMVDRQKKHDKWLECKLGRPPYRYRWGEITSELDPRSGSSFITFRFYHETYCKPAKGGCSVINALNMVKKTGEGVGYSLSPEEEQVLRGIAGIITYLSATIYWRQRCSTRLLMSMQKH